MNVKPIYIKNGIGIGFALAGAIYGFYYLGNWPWFADALMNASVRQRMEIFGIMIAGSVGLISFYIYAKVGKLFGSLWSYIYENSHYYEQDSEDE